MGRRPSYRSVNGMRMPLGFPPGALASGIDYRPAARDIFVASYPKCGTTWLQYIVYLLVRGESLGPEQQLTDVFPHLEEVGEDRVAQLPAPRLIKTHLRFGLTPFSDSARYLVIARNPFDCAVSFFHHTRGFVRHYDFADGTFEDFFECFVQGEVDFGDYFEHLLSWQAEASRANIFCLRYEDLRADSADAIGRIAAFLEIDADAESPRARVEAIVAESDLASMQRDQQRWSSRRPDWAPPFVRKGAVGEWQQLFTPAMAASLLAKCDRCLGEGEVDRIWPGIAAEARAFAH
jgi:hypothetical protein